LGQSTSDPLHRAVCQEREKGLTPDQHGELFFDAIVEGPNKWKVRPVFEIYSDSIIKVSQTFSALAGAIWQVNDKLSFDVAFRYAFVDGHPVNELRARHASAVDTRRVKQRAFLSWPAA
jgi:hypothetical protein